MHKNKIVLTLAFGLLLSPFFAVQAAVTQTSTAVSAQPPKLDAAKMAELKAKLMIETDIIKKNVETSNAGINKILETTKNSIKIKLEITKQDKVRTLLDTIYSNLNEKIGKLTQVDRKISIMIDTTEKAGVDVTKIKAQYTIAKAALDKANGNVLSTRMRSSEQTYMETSKEVIRALVKTAEDSIKAAGAEYRKLIPLISITKSDVKKVETTTTNTVNQ